MFSAQERHQHHLGPNKYAGRCQSCGTWVEAWRGLRGTASDRKTWCTWCGETCAESAISPRRYEDLAECRIQVDRYQEEVRRLNVLVRDRDLELDRLRAELARARAAAVKTCRCLARNGVPAGDGEGKGRAA